MNAVIPMKTMAGMKETRMVRTGAIFSVQRRPMPSACLMVCQISDRTTPPTLVRAPT